MQCYFCSEEAKVTKGEERNVCWGKVIGNRTAT